MKRSLLLQFSIFLLIIVVGGCHGTKQKGISEGEIEYHAVPLDKNNSMASFAPSKMTVLFKDNKSCANLSAAMGLFSTSFIADPNSMTITQLVKLLNKKFAHISDSSDIAKESASLPKIKITPTSETKIIAGYKCKKAIVSYVNDSLPSFPVYYTDDIDISNPNWSNMFHDIHGVLMQYRIEKYGLTLEFTATKVLKKQIDDNIFTVPKDYKKISKTQINQLFKGLE